MGISMGKRGFPREEDHSERRIAIHSVLSRLRRLVSALWNAIKLREIVDSHLLILFLFVKSESISIKLFVASKINLHSSYAQSDYE